MLNFPSKLQYCYYCCCFLNWDALEIRDHSQSLLGPDAKKGPLKISDLGKGVLEKIHHSTWFSMWLVHNFGFHDKYGGLKLFKVRRGEGLEKLL